MVAKGFKVLLGLFVLFASSGEVNSAISIVGAPFSVSENAAVDFVIATGNTNIKVCEGGIDCTAELPKVSILNPSEVENPFGISDTGTLYVANPDLMDFEDSTRNSFEVVIAVTYGLNVARANDQFASFVVQVTDFNEPPYWIEVPTSLSVEEGTAVTLADISDFLFFDPETNAMTCTVGGDCAGVFTFSANTRACILASNGAQTFDYETKTSYACTVQVCETAAPAKCSGTNDFFIQVLDVDDTAPAPSALTATSTLGSAPAGTAITLSPVISFSDVDSNQLIYSIEASVHTNASATDLNLFTVDPATGVIRLKQDYITAGVYYVDLYATDYAGNKSPAPVVCEITVTAVNVLPPDCVESWVLLEQSDEYTALTVNLLTDAIGPQCSDPEGGGLVFTAETLPAEVGGATYTLSAAGVFEVAIDREVMSNFELLVYVADSGFLPVMTTTITLAVICNPTNDIDPTITDGITEVRVYEGQQAGTQVIGPRLWYDEDASESQSEAYFTGGTFEGACDGLFQVDPQDGAVYLVKSFNFNDQFNQRWAWTECDYTAEMCNLDGTCTDMADVRIIIVNINDQAPLMISGSVSVTISEGTTIGTSVTTVLPRDYDQNYDPASSNDFWIAGDALAKEYFELNGLDVEVLKEPNIDDGSPSFFDITIMARDDINSPMDVIHVYVTVEPAEEHDPEFEKASYTASLDENANQVGSIVASMQLFDFDVEPHGVDQISFAITAGDDDSNFYVEAAGMNPSLHSIWAEVRVKKIVNYEETGASIALTIRATGSGTPATTTLTISVGDVEDVYVTCPQLFLATGVVENTTPVSTTVGAAITCTPSAGLTFQSTHPNFDFSGNQMIVAADAAIDYETEQTAEFYIVITDTSGFYTNEIPATVQISPVNEFAPTFYPGTVADVTIAENSPVGTVVASIDVIDNDLGSNHMIDPTSLTLTNTHSGLFALSVTEIVGGYHLEVLLSDEPDAETSTGPYTITVTADDADNSETLSFDVLVSDVDEFAPTCTKTAFVEDEDENIAAGSVIITNLGCVDADAGGSVFYLIASDPSGKFQITTPIATGRFGLKAGETLDYDEEGGSQHVVVVNVMDAALRSITICIIVNVNPINQGTPTFAVTNPTVNLRETTKTGTCFYQFAVTDSDWHKQSHGQVTFTTISASSNFLVDQFTGVVCLVKPIDFEGTTSYTIDVQARNADGTASTTNSLTVSVTNDNDNEPQCTHYVTGSQAEGTAANTNIVSLGCNDVDGDGSTLAYISDSPFFTLTAAGVIQNALVLSRKAASEHSFYVYVTDSSGASIEGSPHTIRVPVTITVSSVDDGGPSCVTAPGATTTTTEYHTTISENSESGLEVIQVFGRDLNDLDSPHGIPEDATDTYSFDTSVTDSYYFSIDPKTGHMYVAGPIDLEKITSPLEVNVIVTDGASNTVTCTVSVTVTDVNDLCPVFASTSYQTSVDEETTTISLTLAATDADDSAPANTVTYAITSSTASTGTFTIGSASGVLAISSAPDYDIMEDPYYVLVVTATDNGGLTGFCQSSVTVGVTVNHQNDNTPVLNAASYTATVAENAPIGTVLVDTVTASDIDLGIDGELYYSLVTVDSRFTIDRLTGVIRLAERLNIDPNQATASISITFGVYDNGTPQRSDTATVAITVTDSNDNAPLCVSYDLQTFILESDSLPKTTTAVLSCDDNKDSSTTISYEIETVNGIDYSEFQTQSLTSFAISTGDAIVVDGAIDYEKDTSFLLKIAVLDTFAGETQTSTVYVTVFVNKDWAINPAFLLPTGSYQIEVAEDTPVDTAVLDLQSDMEVDGYSVIYLKTSTTESKFAVDPNTGVIYVSDTLDRESTASYSLTVEVHFHSSYTVTGVPGTAVATVDITVTDVNDNPPTFNPKRYVVKVPETATPGTVLTTLAVTDLDSGQNGEISSMSVISGDTSGLFSISQSFELEVQKALDFDAVTYAIYSVGIRAKDSGSPVLSGRATVFVEVVPVNEAAPQFATSSYSFSMSEDEDIGYAVGTVVATDSDMPATTDGRFSYVLAGPSGSEFWVDPNSGVIYLHQTVDYETPTTEVVLIVEARDFGYDASYASYSLTGTTSVTIAITDANDNTPSCGLDGMFRTKVSETSTGPSSDLDVFDLGVRCSDVDTTVAFRDLSFSIDSYDPSAMNQLQITNEGMIYLPQNQAISFEQFENVTLSISVKDNAGSCGGGACNVLGVSVFVEIVNENQFAPTITQTAAAHSVSEGDPVGTVVTTLTAGDLDNGVDGEFDLFIQSGNVHRDFELQDTGTPNQYNVVVARTLNRERTASYDLVVVGKDMGSPSLTGTSTVVINVDDVNDPPVCLPTNYHVTLPEATVISNNFLEFQCYDADSTTSGLDYASLTYDITSETQYPAVTVLFSGFTFEIDTGLLLQNQLKLATGITSLDYEDVTHYLLIAEVYDNLGAVPSNTVTTSVYITIQNLNDNSPVFDPIANCTIDESHAIGVLTPACSITAQDADREPFSGVTYRIISDDSPGKFSIDSSTGAISLKETIDTDSMNLGGAASALVELSVEACDCDVNATNRRCTTDEIFIVVDDVVDSAPVCDPTYYELTVLDGDDSVFNATSSYYFQQVIACSDTDFGDSLTYAATVNSGTAADWTMSGNNLQMVSKPDFDLGSQEYDITVVATDSSGMTATVTLNVGVVPVNEFTPSVAAASPTGCTVSECAAYPATCMTIALEDQDFNGHPHGQVSVSIQSGNTHNAFEFVYDWTTNTAVLRQNGPVDREATSGYNMSVLLTDSNEVLGDSLTYSEYMQVYVTGCNDNYPVFDPQTYAVQVADTITDTQVIVTLLATDADVAVGGTLTYSFDASDTDTNTHFTSLFELTNTNEISLQTGQFLTSGSFYRLVMLATDNGSPSKSAHASVSIYVSDASNSPPTFTGPATFSVPETDVIGTVVGTQSASDPDADVMQYSILSTTFTPAANTPPVQPVFWIHPTTGVIYTAAPLDYETNTQFVLTVEAKDAFNVTVSETVTIDVTDVNDNVVNCTRGSKNGVIHITWSEDDVVGTTYDLNNQVADIENPSGSYVFTTLAGTDDYTIFNSDFDMNATGVIEEINSLDYERQKKYVWTVQITDADANPTALTTTCVVEISISDVNEFGPHFEPEIMFASVYEEESFPIPVLNLSIIDDDGSTAQNTLSASPTIVSGDPLNSFLVQPNADGVQTLIVQATLDRDTGNDSYILELVANDTGTPVMSTTATVYVTVLDINDNPPVWNTSPINLKIKECVGINEPIPTTADLSLYVDDIDAGNFSIINFRLAGGSVSSYWNIDQTTGMITSKTNLLDREGSPVTWSLTVEAYDPSNNSLANSVVVNIVLTDCNDNVPNLKLSTYHYTIDSTSAANSVVNPIDGNNDIALINDYDYNATVNGDIMWLLTGGENNDTDFFYIDNGTGIIYTMSDGTLLSNNQTFYTLYVNVTDGEFHDNLTVSIEVLFTFNNYTPQFTQNQFSVSLIDSKTRGETVLVLTATDADVRPILTYSILATSTGSDISNPTQAQDLFIIQSGSRILEVRDALSYEDTNPNPFDFLVEVNDGANVDTATVSVTIYSATNNPFFQYTDNPEDNLYSFVYLTDLPTGANAQYVGRVRSFDVNDTRGSTVSYSLEETVLCDKFGIDDEGYVYVLTSETVEPFRIYWCFITAFLDDDPTINNQATVRIDTCPASECAVRLTIDNPPTYDNLTQFDANNGRLLDAFEADATDTLRLVYGEDTSYIKVAYHTQVSSLPSSKKRNRVRRSSVDSSDTYAYVAGFRDNSTNYEDTVGAQSNFIPGEELHTYLSQSAFYQAPFEAGGDYPILSDSATRVSGEQQSSSSTPWAQTAAGIATITICCILGLALIGGLVAGALYLFAKRTPVEIPETGPDMEARKNWKKAMRKAMLMSRLTTAKAIDPVTGRVYVYNKLTKATRWLKTKDGAEVPSNTALNPDIIDDPNPLAAESGEDRFAKNRAFAEPTGAFRPQRARPAPIEEEEEE